MADTCGHNHCGACCGGTCGGGCGSSLFLTQAELDILRCFAQIPFLPVARRADSEAPVCLEDGLGPAGTRGAAIAALERKALIRLDYGLPLQNFDYTPYQAYRHRGSMALTARGQRVVEQLEIQGIEA